MRLIDDSAISRGMVRVEPGEDLVESLQALAQAAGWRDALVTGAGVLELVELLLPDGGTITLENAELTSLSGRIHRGQEGRPVVALRASVTADAQIRTGRITAAMTGGLILVVDAIHDEARKPAVSRTAPPPTMRAAGGSSSEHTTPQQPGVRGVPAEPGVATDNDGQRAATKPLSQSFSTKPVVTRPTMGSQTDDEEHENPLVDIGDKLIHPQLGVCEVIGDDPSGGTQIRLPSGKTRVLRLDALHILPAAEELDGHTVFKVEGPRRRR